ncbi:MAG: Type 1 glutamine amidotransferase-like domain-containing protein [Anaerolineae bacterium]
MVNHARLILAGGGSAQDSLPLDEAFATWIGPHGRMLYLPVALRERGIPYDQCLAWIQSVFRPLGISGIEMWTDLGEHDPDELAAFDAVYLGGGNTFSLLAQLRASGLGTALVRFAQRGGAIYGGSAGAIVLGRDIMTCAHLDSNDVGLADTRGLDLVAGHDIWCHYRPDEDARIAEYVRGTGRPVLAVSERAGVAVHGARIESAGFEPAYRFDENGIIGILKDDHTEVERVPLG